MAHVGQVVRPPARPLLQLEDPTDYLQLWQSYLDTVFGEGAEVVWWLGSSALPIRSFAAKLWAAGLIGNDVVLQFYDYAVQAKIPNLRVAAVWPKTRNGAPILRFKLRNRQRGFITNELSDELRSELRSLRERDPQSYGPAAPIPINPDPEVGEAVLSGTLVAARVYGWDAARAEEDGTPLLEEVNEYVEGPLQKITDERDRDRLFVRDYEIDPATLEVIDRSVILEGNRKAEYRALQGWYREAVLNINECGRDGLGREVTSLLPEGERDANFLDASVARYVDERLVQVRKENGKLPEPRLRWNMLSSSPLCFNLFGYLRDHPVPLARVLNDVFKLDISSIDSLEAEWAPQPPEKFLDDGTAFDAFLEYTDAEGKKCFVAFETKYTEALGTQVIKKPERYPRAGQLLGIEISGVESQLTHQVWRNTLLALMVKKQRPYASGLSVIVSLGSDNSIEPIMAEVKKRVPDGFLRWIGLEELVSELGQQAETSEWAHEFTKRYLDLTPLEELGWRAAFD